MQDHSPTSPRHLWAFHAVPWPVISPWESRSVSLCIWRVMPAFVDPGILLLWQDYIINSYSVCFQLSPLLLFSFLLPSKRSLFWYLNICFSLICMCTCLYWILSLWFQTIFQFIKITLNSNPICQSTCNHSHTDVIHSSLTCVAEVINI